MTKIKMIGYGHGQGEEVEVLERRQLEEKIESLESTDIIKTAWDGFNAGYKTGYAVIDLRNGELYTESLGQNETNQAIDNTYIIIYKFDQNFDIGDIVDFDIEEDEDVVEVMIETLDYDFSLDYIDIDRQLDEFYCPEME